MSWLSLVMQVINRLAGFTAIQRMIVVAMEHARIIRHEVASSLASNSFSSHAVDSESMITRSAIGSNDATTTPRQNQFNHLSD